MFSSWNGAFRPMVAKHRDYCGILANHLDVTSIEPITAETAERLEMEIEERVKLGSGQSEWLVRVEFVESGDQQYEFIVLTDGEEPDEEQVISEVESYFEAESG